MDNLNKNTINSFFEKQLSEWSLAGNNYSNLKDIKTKRLVVNDFDVVAQFNPSRIISSNAKVDPASIKNRPCFLCEENRPQAQRELEFISASDNRYSILVNPFPIFNKHFTISSSSHSPQTIFHRYEDMLQLTTVFEGYVIFYNGAECGASSPDHMHFQAIESTSLPIVNHFTSLKKRIVFSSEGITLSILTNFIIGAYVIESISDIYSENLFYKVIEKISGDNNGRMINVLSWKSGGQTYTVIFHRKRHRPDCFYDEGPNKMLISPASVDLGGVFILPIEEDFNKISGNIIENVVSQVCVNNMNRSYQPDVSVGLMSGNRAKVLFISPFICGSDDVQGSYIIEYENGKIKWNGKLTDQLNFEPLDYNSSLFEIEDVTIGIDFHWERKENQRFKGGLKVILYNNSITLINCVGVEDYLLSVISSEMNSNAPIEFLKAHVVISRSWLLAQIVKKGEIKEGNIKYTTCEDNGQRRIKWYDREDHTLFDVCADDHCQRYQGLLRATNEKIKEVIDQTWGEVLKYGNEICDARFSKCCGGVTEVFSTCWEDKNPPYLSSKLDLQVVSDSKLDLKIEDNAKKWILSYPKSFCNTSDEGVLSQVLNNYDQETKNFYRWRVEYSQEELSILIREKTGIDFGEIVDLIPLKRGESGRIYELRIVGVNHTMVIGKELEIRKVLSKSHLYSSAFIVDKVGVNRGKEGLDIPSKFVLNGSGWGHGVGLCQIGAAVMGESGYKYQEILLHYFSGSKIESYYLM